MTTLARPDRSRWFVPAAVAGGLHAVISAYWAVGGQALLWTMGASFVAQFDGLTWVLIPVAAVKMIAAVAPLWLERRRWPLARLIRPLGWLTTAVLIAWGGLNTVVGNLVLVGIIRPDDGFDRGAMIGHAWLWDPLFLIWGVCLAMGLWRTRLRRFGERRAFT